MVNCNSSTRNFASESIDSSDDEILEPESSSLRGLDTNIAVPNAREQTGCTSHQGHSLLLRLPLSKEPSDFNHVTAIATELIALQQNQDAVLANLRNIVRLTPAESAHQIEEQLNSFIQNCKGILSSFPNTSKSQVSTIDIQNNTNQTFESNKNEENENIEPHSGLVAFTRRRKEARKPSYGIR